MFIKNIYIYIDFIVLSSAIRASRVDVITLLYIDLFAKFFSLRNYHVFYYLLAGANTTEIESFRLGSPREYFYLNQVTCFFIYDTA